MTTVTEVWSASAHLFAGMWRPLVSVITPLYYVNAVIFFIVECRVARFLCAMHVLKVRASSSSPEATFVQNFVAFAASVAEPAHRNNRVLTHSPSLSDAPGTEALALLNKTKVNKLKINFCGEQSQSSLCTIFGFSSECFVNVFLPVPVERSREYCSMLSSDWMASSMSLSGKASSSSNTPSSPQTSKYLSKKARNMVEHQSSTTNHGCFSAYCYQRDDPTIAQLVDKD